jgi:hypothetical protein
VLSFAPPESTIDFTAIPIDHFESVDAAKCRESIASTEAIDVCETVEAANDDHGVERDAAIVAAVNVFDSGDRHEIDEARHLSDAVAPAGPRATEPIRIRESGQPIDVCDAGEPLELHHGGEPLQLHDHAEPIDSTSGAGRLKVRDSDQLIGSCDGDDRIEVRDGAGLIELLDGEEQMETRVAGAPIEVRDVSEPIEAVDCPESDAGEPTETPNSARRIELGHHGVPIALYTPGPCDVRDGGEPIEDRGGESPLRLRIGAEPIEAWDGGEPLKIRDGEPTDDGAAARPADVVSVSELLPSAPFPSASIPQPPSPHSPSPLVVPLIKAAETFLPLHPHSLPSSDSETKGGPSHLSTASTGSMASDPDDAPRTPAARRPSPSTSGSSDGSASDFSTDSAPRSASDHSDHAPRRSARHTVPGQFPSTSEYSEDTPPPDDGLAYDCSSDDSDFPARPRVPPAPRPPSDSTDDGDFGAPDDAPALPARSAYSDSGYEDDAPSAPSFPFDSDYSDNDATMDDDADLALSDPAATEIDRMPHFDDRDLQALIFDCWRTPKSSPPGEPADHLFELFPRQLRLGINRLQLQQRTAVLLDEMRSVIPPSDLENAFFLFVAYHRFYTLLTRSGEWHRFAKQMKPIVNNVLQWLIVGLQHSIMADFLTCTQRLPSVREFGHSLEQIRRLRAMLVLPIGDFVWNRLLVAVDGGLANQLLNPQKFTTIHEIHESIRFVNSFSKESGIFLPIFLQSMQLMLDYETLVSNRVPFEMQVKNVPPDFFIALIFIGKRKGLIRLEVNDQKLLNLAEYLNIDISKIESTSLAVDETRTDIRLSVWS